MYEITKKNYIFGVDVLSKTFKITVGRSCFFMCFPDFNFSKIVFGENSISIIEALSGIDIVYKTSNNFVKEDIIIKDKNHVNNIRCQVSMKNCMIFYNKINKNYSIIGNKGKDIFSFGKITSYNSKKEIESFAKISYDSLLNIILYSFKTLSLNEYPITVDPTFLFPSEAKTASKDDISSQNNMFIVGLSSADKLIEDAEEITNPLTGSKQKLFSSDDVVFEKDIQVIFPYLNPNNVDSVSLQIEHSGSLRNLTFPKSGDNAFVIASYLVGETLVSYIYVVFSLKSNLVGTVKVIGDVNFNPDLYGNFSVSFSRTFFFVFDVNLRMSSENIVYNNENELLKNNIVVSHFSKFSPLEYNILPYEFEDENINKFTETVTFSIAPTKVENRNPARTNVHFKFDPSIIPTPSFKDSRQDSSAEIDMETLLKTLPGMDYELLDNDGNPMPKFYKISNPGNWEFWALFPNINYDIQNSSPDIRAYIAVKNNSRFKRTILKIIIGGQGSFRKEWKPGITDANDFWQMFFDNTGPVEKDLFQKLADEYIVNKKSPYVSNGIGINMTVPFRRILDQDKPGEYLELKCSIKVSGNNFFDIIYEYRNTTSEKLKLIGNSNAVDLIYGNNFFQYNQGIDIDMSSGHFVNIKRNDFRDSQFDWIPIDRSLDSLKTNITLSEFYGVTSSTTSDRANLFVYTVERNLSNIEMKPGNMIANGDFEFFTNNIPASWTFFPSDSENFPVTIKETSIVFSGTSSLRWSHDGNSVGIGVSNNLKFPSLSQAFLIGNNPTIRDKRLYYSYQIRAVLGTNKTKTTLGFGTYNNFQEISPSFGNVEVNYDDSKWTKVFGYFELSDLPSSNDSQEFFNNEVRILIRPTSENSVQEAILDDVRISLLSSTQIEPPSDPRNDIRFISTELDPRWYSGRIYSQIVHDFSDPNNWPHVLAHDDWSVDDVTSDAWYFEEQIEPFIIFDRELPVFDPEIGVLAIVAEHPYGMFYNTQTTIDRPTNEFLNHFGINSGVPELSSKSLALTRVRFYFDTENGSRESWYNNVFLNIDFADTDYFSIGSIGTSNSFKNNIEVALKSAINDRTNIESGSRFKSEYVLIDSDDFVYTISNEDGTVIPGKISLVNSDFNLYPIQKTNFLYQKSLDKGFEVFSDVHIIKCSVIPPVDDPLKLIFTAGSTIRQNKTGSSAIIIKETVNSEDGSVRTLYVYRVVKEFDEVNIFTEVSNFSGSSGKSGTPIGKTIPIYNGPHTFVKFVSLGENNESIDEDEIFFEEFDRPYDIILKDELFQESWGLKKLSDDIFAGGYFHYETGNLLKTAKIISNTSSTILLSGTIKSGIKNSERFLITLFNPDKISFDFTGNYKEKTEVLQKLRISTDGSILYGPIKINLESNNQTEIIASVRDSFKKFGGISKKVTIGGESVFDFTGIVESNVRVFGYVMSENDSESLNPEKIPLAIGGENLDVIIVPKDLKDKIIYLDVRTALPSQNVRAIINKTDGTELEVNAEESITDKRFIVKINQNGISYHNIEIVADPAAGSSLDPLGILENDEDAGISLENDVITKTLYKAINYARSRDFIKLDNFDSINFTSTAEHNGKSTNKNRLAFKTFIDNFTGSAIVHTTSDHFWFTPTAASQPASPTLFIPAYAKDSNIKENYWKKSGSENILNYISYVNNSGIDMRFYLKYYFQEKHNWFFTEMDYVNRGVDINNLVMLYRIDLHHLLEFLPDSLLLPRDDFSTEEKANYDLNFRNYVSRNFFFSLPDGSQVGIGSQDLIQGAGANINVGDSVIYPIGYQGVPQSELLPIGGVISKLQYNDENISNDIKVSNKNVGVQFFLNKEDGSGRIVGTLFFEGNLFLKEDMGSFQLTDNDFIRPFIGHSGAGDSLLYGAGLKKLTKNRGFYIGMILQYQDF